ncbi:MAG TPA: type IX secretion system membrane protein PorP/SprF [Flavobacteriales bacterium]|nr:type IX secretion system membrane protein PorP/SprF [Flavobacteriales bacterium]HIN39315.1 type IX secretion system membrane protein PorP/SprF [Flavobacteriales bacterium]
MINNFEILKKLRTGSLILLVFAWHVIHAQDLHFSTPFRAPLLLNPALTGAMPEDYRVVSAYKNQWASVGAPFKTIYASYDMHLLSTNDNNNGLDAGMSFFNDKAGKTSMGLTQLNLILSYKFQIKEVQFLSAGVQMGYVQRSINYEGIKWDSQYNGVGYDPALPTGEMSLLQNNSYLDAGAGITWKYIPSKKFFAKLGGAMYHLTMANGSYLEAAEDQLNLKMVLHGEGEMVLNDQFAILPQLVAFKKGAAFEVNAGSFLKYVTGERSKYTDAMIPSTISVGCFYRYLDAVIASVLYEYRRILSIGISYDLNVSPLKVASSSRGGIEITLQYRGFFEKGHIKL